MKRQQLKTKIKNTIIHESTIRQLHKNIGTSYNAELRTF